MKVYRVGMYSGKIYGPEVDVDTITECCKLYKELPVATGVFPSDKCTGCNACPESQNSQVL